MGGVKKFALERYIIIAHEEKKIFLFLTFKQIKGETVRFGLLLICLFIYCVFDCKCDTTTKSSKPNDLKHFN
jgi:hypothetical protein